MTEAVENLNDLINEQIEGDNHDQDDDQDNEENQNTTSKSSTPLKKKGKPKKVAKGKQKKTKDQVADAPILTAEQQEALRKKEEKEKELQKILEATANLEFKVAAPEPRVNKPMKFNNYYAKKYGGKTQEELDLEEKQREEEKQKLMEEERIRQQQEEQRMRKIQEEEDAKKKEEERIRNARDSMLDGSLTGRESNANRESVGGPMIGGVKKDSYYMRKYIKQIQEAEEMERKRQQEIKEREMQEQIRRNQEEAEKKAEEERQERERQEKIRLEKEAADKARQEEEEKQRILQEEMLRREKFNLQRDERNRSLFNQHTQYTPEQIAQIASEFKQKREKERQAEIELKKQEMEEIEIKYQQMIQQDEMKKNQKILQIEREIKDKNQQLQEQEIKYLKSRYNEISGKGVVQQLSTLQVSIQQINDIKSQAKQILSNQNSIKQISKYNVNSNQQLKDFEERINQQKMSIYQQVQEASVIQKVQLSIADDIDSTELTKTKQQAIEPNIALQTIKLNNSLNLSYNNIKTQFQPNQNQKVTPKDFKQPKLLPQQLTNSIAPGGTQLPIKNLDYQYIQNKNLKQQMFGTFRMYNLINIYNSKTAHAFMKENNIDSKYKLTTFSNIKSQYFALNNIEESSIKSDSVRNQIRSTSQKRQYEQQANIQTQEIGKLHEIEEKEQIIIQQLLDLKQTQYNTYECSKIKIDYDEIEYGFKTFPLAQLINIDQFKDTDELFTVVDIMSLIINNINDTEVQKGNEQNNQIIEKSLQMINMLNQMLVKAVITTQQSNKTPKQHKSMIITKHQLEQNCSEKYKFLFKQFVDDIKNVDLMILKMYPTQDQINNNQLPKLTGNELTYDIRLKKISQYIDLLQIDDNTELISLLTSYKATLKDILTVELTKNNITINQNFQEVNKFIDLFIKILIMCKKYLMSIYTVPDPKIKNQTIIKYKEVNIKDENVTITKQELQSKYANEYYKQYTKFIEQLGNIELQTYIPHRLSLKQVQMISGCSQYKVQLQMLDEILEFSQIQHDQDILTALDQSIIKLNKVISDEEKKNNQYNQQTIQDCNSYFANIRELLCNLVQQQHQFYDSQKSDNVKLTKQQLFDIKNADAIEIFNNLQDCMQSVNIYTFLDKIQNQETIKSHSQIDLISQNAKDAQEKVLQIQQQICQEQKEFIKKQEELKQQERYRQQQLEIKRQEDKIRQQEEQKRIKEEEQLRIQQQIQQQKERIAAQQKLQQELILKQQMEAKQKQLEKLRQEELAKQQQQQQFLQMTNKVQEDTTIQLVTSDHNEDEQDHTNNNAGKKKKTLKVGKKLKQKQKKVVEDEQIEDEQNSVQQVPYQEDDQYAQFELERQKEYEKQLIEQQERIKIQSQKEEEQKMVYQQKLTSRINKSTTDQQQKDEQQTNHQQIDEKDEEEQQDDIKNIQELTNKLDQSKQAQKQSIHPIVQPFAAPEHFGIGEQIDEQHDQDSVENLALTSTTDAEEASKSQSPATSKKQKKSKIVSKKGQKPKKQNITVNPFENTEEGGSEVKIIDETIDLFG